MSKLVNEIIRLNDSYVIDSYMNDIKLPAFTDDDFCKCCKTPLEPVDENKVCWDCEYTQHCLFPNCDSYYFAGLLEESKEWMQ